MHATKPWYGEGLDFECTGCGDCCTGAPGHVWLTPDELRQMSSHLGLSVAEFSRRYTRRVGQRISLIEDRKSYDCVFLKDSKCSVYSVRPQQCRTFPWWPQNLDTPLAWQRAAADCEGMRTTTQRVAFEQIEDERQKQEVANAAYSEV